MSTGLRIGQGYDVHAFISGDHVMLGGERVPHTRGVLAHSDGDVLLHAICDALLGAAGLGDIGGMFPSGDERWRDADSLELLRAAWSHVAVYGYTLSNVDATVIAEAPRLAPHVPAMRSAIASALSLDPTNVSVKATTADGMGFTGRGEGVAALATVLLE
jgi:2-C-methyl-D-erythritol 2,4-cyclodiphosphate synthase